MNLVKQNAAMIKGMLTTLEPSKDVTISQSMEVTKHPASKGENINQFQFANVHIQSTVQIAKELLDEIIEYREPVKVEQVVEPVIDDMIQDVCDLAYGRKWEWTKLLKEVTTRFAMTAERHHKTIEGAAGSINMDKTTYRKYIKYLP